MDENDESLVFVTIWDCGTHVPMMSMTSSVERTDLDFKISVALLITVIQWVYDEINPSTYRIVSKTSGIRENIHKLLNRQVCNNVIGVLHTLFFFYLSIKQEQQSLEESMCFNYF